MANSGKNHNPDITKGLIIKTPWISLILSGHKTWEMRSRKTKIRGKIALIEQGTGTIVGEAELVDCLDELSQKECLQYFDKHWVCNLNELKKWKYPWVLANVVKYDEPIPYNHKQGAVIWVNL